MKKNLLIALSLCAGTLLGAAQSKIDAPTTHAIQAALDASASRASGTRALLPASVADEPMSFILTFTDESALDAVRELGGEVSNVRADMALVSLTPAQALEAAKLESVKSISSGYEARPLLNTARKTSHVDEVHAGTGLDKAYDGSGVVVGIMDTGLDMNHVNFLDANGEPRTKRMWIITGSNSALRTLSTPEEIKNYTTDTSDETHGTHVMGILAGQYTGTGAVAFINKRGKLQTKIDGEIPYYGVATGADLAPCAGTLQGTNIERAAEHVLAYAKELGKPAVMNLSLGHNYGPHDGTTPANKYLAELGKEMLICISAGNEAGGPLSISKKFNGGESTVKTCLSTGNSARGVVDIWSDDATAFTVTFQAVDVTDGSVKYSYTFDGSVPEVTLTGTYYNAPGYIRDSKLDDLFSAQSALSCTAGKNANNGRYNMYISVVLGNGANKNIRPVFVVDGKGGKGVNIYGNNLYFYTNGLAGYTAGDDSQSINDMACGQNVISVGAYTNVSEWPTLHSGMLAFTDPGTPGAVASFSSYGTTFDGRQLPIISAPGEAIISSYSNYYMEGGSGNKNYAVAVVDGKDRSSYWLQMSGTSMSSPFVAGVMALWLQADPNLTIDEVKDILAQTSIKDDFTAAAPHRFGYGKIDALAGIKKILGLGSVNDVKVDGEVLVSESARGTYSIFAPGASTIEAALYGLNGGAAATVTAAGENATLSAEGVAAGIYILRVNADGRTTTRKVAVR